MVEEEFCVVISTSPGEDHAMELAESLVERGLAACVQIMPIKSVYVWKKAVSKDAEVLILAKTRTSKYEDVQAFIRNNHPYEVPEIIRIDIRSGLPEYLSWIRDAT